MWSQIVGVLVLLVIATYVIQFFMPRASSSNVRRASMRWDVAPVIAFFGIVMLALSFVEALRQMVVQAWGGGIVLGLGLSVAFWTAWNYREGLPAPQTKSAIVATIRMLRTYGAPVILAIIGIYIAVRVFGPVVQVLVAGALGILIITIALRMFARSKTILSAEDKHGKI